MDDVDDMIRTSESRQQGLYGSPERRTGRRGDIGREGGGRTAQRCRGRSPAQGGSGEEGVTS
jgi:hypothetical protein